MVRVRMPSSDFEVYRQWAAPETVTKRRAPDVLTVIDAGANIGISTRVLAERFPRARIIAIELEAANAALLRRNTACVDRVTCLHAGLWAEDCDLVVADGPDASSWSFHAVPLSASPALDRGRMVPGMSMHTILERFGIDRLDVLKVDIEGGEVEVFAGADDWIDRVDGVMIELHERLRPGSAALIEDALERLPIRWTEGELMCAAREGAAILESLKPRDADDE